MRLSDFQALSFDCYGTLIDWETGICAALQPLCRSSGASCEELLEAFGPIEAAVEEEDPSRPYSSVLEEVHARLCGRFGIPSTPGDDRAFGASVGDWPAFPDSAEALAYLQRHFRLIILSNVDHRSFEKSQKLLGVEFDHVYTAQDIGSYKPDPRNFEYLLDHVQAAGILKEDLLHVAQSLFHDHVPANRIGLASAWIDRRGAKPGSGATVLPEPMPRFDFHFASLAELADAHRAEQD